jgi:hypothetical protein
VHPGPARVRRAAALPPRGADALGLGIHLLRSRTGQPHGGGTVILGVAWFDQAFFDDRRDAWFGAMHTRIYQTLGIPLDNITVTHWAALAS